MPCPQCHSTSMTVLDHHIEYDDEPLTFGEGEILHLHDFNSRVTKWKCNQGHEFELRGKKSCTGCFLERSLVTKIAQEQSARVSRPQRAGGNDHHTMNFYLPPDHGAV